MSYRKQKKVNKLPIRVKYNHYNHSIAVMTRLEFMFWHSYIQNLMSFAFSLFIGSGIAACYSLSICIWMVGIK